MKVLVNETSLTNIADAIREKNGTEDAYKPAQMAAAIAALEVGGGGTDIPEEAFTISGDCSYRFASGGWDWFLRDYGNKIKTENITNATYMFRSSTADIPFNLNFEKGTNIIAERMFYNSRARTIGDLVNLKPENLQYIFADCHHLRELPKLINFDKSVMETASRFYLNYMFQSCYSLRTIPPEWLDMDNPKTSTYTQKITTGLTYLYSVDEIVGIYPTAATMTTNHLNNGFNSLYRAKNITFKLDESGQPFVRSWKSQTMDLTGNIGFTLYNASILSYTDYNGITADKEVSGANTYQALKNDNDWFATNAEYGRYNHDSAVNTINSLPDTSAYLASAGGTNTVKFDGSWGRLTDGGAINTLTEEEIAVAAAKGWTISYV
jgi:hypothetical protein